MPHNPPRLNNGADFTATAVMTSSEIRTSGSLISSRAALAKWICGSFNGKLRDEYLNRERFVTPHDAKILIAKWRQFYHRTYPTIAQGVGRVNEKSCFDAALGTRFGNTLYLLLHNQVEGWGSDFSYAARARTFLMGC
ncbi:integrase core domain-containing protein [Nitrosovibrio tenuis]|uniref:Integrase core domain-containing protein n=1 Tax=Nitrosovibrio tenuis TaxID=1233 RepID=A0A1H7LPP4_9PROT|nr:Integrase core domain-containing protein [Nitrosovibrio tenuis]